MPIRLSLFLLIAYNVDSTESVWLLYGTLLFVEHEKVCTVWFFYMYIPLNIFNDLNSRWYNIFL